MKLFKSSLILSIALTLGLSNAMATQHHRKVRAALPPNNLHLMDNPSRVQNIDEKTFNAIIDQAQAYFTPVFAKHNAKLTVVRRWNDSTVNAYAEQQGSNWLVTMFGGLARRPEISADGFALVICHEIGHHLGGYAFIDDDWASTEGNSDYFSTQACARALWGRPSLANHYAIRYATRLEQQACDAVWKDQNSREVCYRSINAGQSLANLLAAIGGEKQPHIETPDQTQVSSTYTEHPAAQCRLDTYVQGALCAKPFDLNVIPGRGNSAGQDSAAAETESMKYTCYTSQGFQLGFRPRCWFKPKIENPFHRQDSTEMTPVLSQN
ncbi:MAG: hypothetical protein ACJ763_15355 [Bdellovibrionia bacterium]